MEKRRIGKMAIIKITKNKNKNIALYVLRKIGMEEALLLRLPNVNCSLSDTKTNALPNLRRIN